MTKTLNISEEDRALLTDEELAGMEEGQEFDEGQDEGAENDDNAGSDAADSGKPANEAAAPAEVEGKKADTSAEADDDADAPAAASDDGAKAGDAASSAEASATADAGGDDADLAAFVTVPPIPVSKLPDDFDDKLKAVSADKKALATQLDEGDLTMAEYHEKLDALNKQERELERTKDRVESSEAQRYDTWSKVHVTAFMNVHKEYKANDMLTGLLDQEVRKLQAGGKYASDTDPQILVDAHKKIAASFPGAFAEPAKPAGKDAGKSVPKPQQHKTVPTLARTPASDIDEPGEGEFSGLDRLADTDPLRYQDELERLARTDPAKYDRYLQTQ